MCVYTYIVHIYMHAYIYIYICTTPFTPRLSDQKREHNDLINSLRLWMNTRKHLIHQGSCKHTHTVLVTAHPRLTQTSNRTNFRMVRELGTQS